MDDRDTALNAAVRLAGPERGHDLLGCDWGTRVALPGDREVCTRQARQRIAIHGAYEAGPGEVPGILDLKLCEEHRDRVMAETDPHAAGGEP